MQLITVLLIGFSIFSAPLLILKECCTKPTAQTWFSRLAGVVLIFCLAAIQFLNLRTILEPNIELFSSLYILLLYCIAPGFYFFSYQTLEARNQSSLFQLLHLTPIFLNPLFPDKWSVPLAFFIGSLYLIWLARAIYFLREQRKRFKQELLAIAGLFCIAIAVVALGFFWPIISHTTFVMAYSILIGLAFFGVMLTILIFPSITTDVIEAAQVTYAESTLNHIDRKKTLDKLTFVMQQEKMYRLETLSLSMVAEQLELSSHQLSELINTEYHQGFSKFIRQYRIEEAKTLLIEEPRSSILSIGLAVGFSTQSNFYSAFSDIVGMAPGKFRKQNAE